MTGSEAHCSWHCVLSNFQFSRFCGVWSGPRRMIRNLAFINETGIFFPGTSPHEEHDVKTSASDVHAQHKIWMLPQPTN